jgi:mRNA interferase HicA
LKRRALERHLADQGCEVMREGSSHTIWHNPPAGRRAPIPRHREIPAGTARAIAANSRSLRPPAHADRPEELSGELVKQAVSVFGYEILPAPPRKLGQHLALGVAQKHGRAGRLAEGALGIEGAFARLVARARAELEARGGEASP